MANTNKAAGFVPALKRKALENATETRSNPGWPSSIRDAEMGYIERWRSARGDDPQAKHTPPLFGLALSGGGIRSATFSLGVMQALAARGLLRKVDCLSTVSGGGYIGSALTWLLSAKADRTRGDKTAQPFGLDADNFPFGSDDPAPEQPQNAGPEQRQMLQYLRDHGYYLTPGSGITALSLLGIVLRGTFLNIAVWMPLFVLFFFLGMLFFNGYAEQLPGMLLLPLLMDDPKATLYGFDLFLSLGCLILILAVVATLVYSVLTRAVRANRHSTTWYRLRRWAERWTTVVFAVVLLLLLVGSLPLVHELLHKAMATVGATALLSGIGMAMRDFIKPSEGGSANTGILATLAAALFLFGGFLLSYAIADELLLWPDHATAITIGIVAWSTVLGWVVNLNYIAIHRYYRDRLMETFMPNIDTALNNDTGAADGANKGYLTELNDPQQPRSPYHLINTNVVLVDSPQGVYNKRGGDSFMLSSLYCGSNATGWCPTASFMQGGMTLATAMAISGAAANPNTGVGGVGLTRNRLVSFVMSLLNLRLGYWAAHPDNGPEHPANHFHPGLYAFGNVMGGDRWGFQEQRKFLALSDGGHFENTGIYELVRRRAGLIIACDGGADAEFSFSDFQTTIRRVQDDFGVRIRVLDNATPDQVVPVPAEGAAYPKAASFAQQGHMVGCIEYPDDSHGWLIFLKTTLIRELSFKVKGYAAQNDTFPDQSTVDQFFDEVQFEAYRELGYRLAATMLDAPAPVPASAPGSDQSSSQDCGQIPEKPADDAKTLEQFIREFCA